MQNETEKPLVTILMNCFNGAEFIAEAIDSVIAQTYPNWELLFWDNQSTDDSAGIVKSYKDERIKYYYAPVHTDLGGGRAAAWEYIRGDYLVVLDTDDYFEPTKLEIQINMFSSEPTAGLCISNTSFFTTDSSWLLYKVPPPIDKGVSQLVEKYYISLESTMISMRVAREHGISFNSNYSHIADFDLMVNICSVSEIVYTNEVLSGWRVHSASDSWVTQYRFYEEFTRWGHANMLNPRFTQCKSSIKRLLSRSRLRLRCHYLYMGKWKELYQSFDSLVSMLSLFYLPVYAAAYYFKLKLDRFRAGL